jgi:copper resistance protein B
MAIDDAREAAPDPAAATCTPEHAAMGHCTMPTAPPPTAASSTPPPKTSGGAQVDAADRIWGADAMRASRAALRREHGGGSFSMLMIDLAEASIRKGADGYRWDGEGWFGGDIDRLVVKTEGEGGGGALEQAEVQALYSRAIGPYFNLQAGVRHDIRPQPQRTYAAIGIEGLAPYWFEVEAHAFLSTRGELLGRVQANYDQRFTQRLVLQPRIELNLAAQDTPVLGTGAGPTDAELGLRLRYEIAREFAPYVGVVHEAQLGRTARYARAAGEEGASTSLVVGVRAWF